MATDAVIDFNDSKENWCRLYIKTDAHVDNLLKDIKKIFKKIDNKEMKKYSHGRLNWDYLATKVIAELISKRAMVRIVSDTSGKIKNVIYHIEITPIPEKYSDTTINATQAINVKAKYASKEDDYLYLCTLSEIK